MRRRVLLALALVLCLLLSACDGLAWLTDPQTTSVPAADPTATAAKPTESAASPSPTPVESTPEPTATPASIPEASPSPTPDWTQLGEEGELTVRQDGQDRQLTAYNREYVLRDSPHLGFCLLVPGELVQPGYDNNAWVFPVGEDAWLELSYIAGTDAGELLPDFMNAYLSFTEIEFSGASTLGTVDMDETITASGGTMLAKAWLLNVPEGVFTVVLCCGTDRLEEALPVLEAMAGTLTLTM